MTKAEDSDLSALAEMTACKAYAPYSGFRVGAALVTKAGHIYAGCNVENASFPVGCCAERNAIATAIASEGPEMRLAAIAVAAIDPTGEAVACAPCGACRQAIIEFGPTARVVFRAARDQVVTVDAAELLPGAFSFRAPAR